MKEASVHGMAFVMLRENRRRELAFNSARAFTHLSSYGLGPSRTRVPSVPGARLPAVHVVTGSLDQRSLYSAEADSADPIAQPGFVELLAMPAGYRVVWRTHLRPKKVGGRRASGVGRGRSGQWYMATSPAAVGGARSQSICSIRGRCGGCRGWSRGGAEQFHGGFSREDGLLVSRKVDVALLAMSNRIVGHARMVCSIHPALLIVTNRTRCDYLYSYGVSLCSQKTRHSTALHHECPRTTTSRTSSRLHRKCALSPSVARARTSSPRYYHRPLLSATAER
jgi:hypothetical protein